MVRIKNLSFLDKKNGNVVGELFTQPSSCANEATLNQSTKSAIGWPGLALEFLEDLGGLQERTGREGKVFQGWWNRKKRGERVSQTTLLCPCVYQVFISISDSWVFITPIM